MDTYVSKCKNGFCFSLKFIYKGQICLKKCLKLCKSVQKCPNISNQNLDWLFNITLNKKDTYVFKCKILFYIFIKTYS